MVTIWEIVWTVIKWIGFAILAGWLILTAYNFMAEMGEKSGTHNEQKEPRSAQEIMRPEKKKRGW